MENKLDPKTWKSVTIAVAVIGCIGILGAAIIGVLPEIIRPTSTLASPSPISNLQVILLRGSCGSDYIVNANQPISIYYGGWGVKGIDLAQQWTTSLTTNLVIDGALVSGEQYPPVDDLPLNCKKDEENIYWLYYKTTLSGFSPGVHEISVTFNTLRALPDELGGKNYEPGKIADITFKITAK